MKHIGKLETLAIGIAIIGSGLALNTTTAQAKGFTWLKTKDYSANPSIYYSKRDGQSVTAWNWNHTKRLFNLAQYRYVPWHVTQSVKMYNAHKKHGKKTGIYYRITSYGKTGYVHRNFLKRQSEAARRQAITYNQDIQIHKLFSETTNIVALNTYAYRLLYSNGTSVDSPFLHDEATKVKIIRASNQPNDSLAVKLAQKQISYSDYVSQDLKRQKIDMAAYKGGLIGIASYPSDKTYADAEAELGDYSIVLLPKEFFYTEFKTPY
ncbi:hypothetical protein [uncultured Secundilactobacillus sp.]|uniref:hypothetical protein n=1 Tax=uncultured Secundilactobacillus sp. TaxID=2813935 RepID=UPI00258A6E95|nr:hypothetical protein [uncultured Secundilactobacillus sp.]